MMLLRYTQESAQPFIYKGYALFISKLEKFTLKYKQNLALNYTIIPARITLAIIPTTVESMAPASVYRVLVTLAAIK